MRLLVANDDGIEAKGIYTLVKELEKFHEVIVVAPDNQRSACGHSITLTEPITIKETSLEGLKSKAYSISGTPADCVRMGLDLLAEGKIDLVVSGINRGYNIGTDVIYSGTVSAAIEASIYDIPSLAVSQEINSECEDYETAAKYALKVIDIFKNNFLGSNVVLNLNIPCCSAENIKGIKVCKLGKTSYKHSYIEYIGENSRGYNVKGVMKDKDYEDDDVDNIRNKYVTLTPMHFNLTNFDMLNHIENIVKGSGTLT